VKTSFKIDALSVGVGQRTFIIAEIGNNHNGSKQLAKKMVDECVAAGVDAVKFQLRDMESLYGKDIGTAKDAVDLGAQYTLDLLAKFQLSNQEMTEVFDYCKERRILAFCTPWDHKSVEFLEKYNLPLYKVASADLTNHELLKRIAATKKPMICSTGMATEDEILAAIKLLKNLDAQFALLHCNSTYPSPFKDVNLNYIRHLQSLTPIVGYSGHERGFHVPLAAVALGATIIEKHFTLDRTMEGIDHRVSLLPQELKSMVQQIRELESALGSKISKRVVTQGELINRENLGKSLVAIRAIEKGAVIQESDLAVRSPGQGLPPYMIDKVVGTIAKRAMKTGDVLYVSDLPDSKKVSPRQYKFRRPWGIPVRYHDTNKLLGMVRPDLLEFHLSYNDMDQPLSKYFTQPHEVDFAVHAPELFAGDHLLDLCSPSLSYRQESIDNMKRVVEVTLQLKEFFPKTKKPLIVANVGGFTANAPLPSEARRPLYDILLESFRQFEDSGVELIPQTMAPFPWHMGGQQYQNLFKFPEEMDWFCREHGYRLCIDVSHCHLTCNHHSYDPEQFYNMIAPHAAHLHLGDSRGVDGEGLQVGEGEIDFKLLGRIFDNHSATASFIPEIWQGHKNDAEGFWIALERLEGAF